MDQSRLNNSLESGERRGRLSLSAALLLAWSLLALALLAPTAGAARSVYATSVYSDGVFGYSIGDGGRLTLMGGSPFTDDNISPLGVAISPDAKHLYMTDGERRRVSVFAIAPDGSLSPIPGSPYATGVSPWGVAVSPDGEHLYVANRGSNSISAWSILFDGSLVPLPDPAVPTTGGKSPNGIAITPDGKHLYVTNLNSANVVGYSIAADGSLSEMEGSPFAAGQTPRPAVVSPDGKYLYVGINTWEDIIVYSIGADGALAQVPGSPFATEGSPLGLALTPDGDYLYTAHIGWKHNVWGYSTSGGALSPVPGTPFPTGGIRGNSAAISPDGKYLYTTNNESDDISAFSIASTGSLKAIPGSPYDTGNGPLQIAVTPDQGPVAEFSATPTPAGNPLSLDASESSDSDGAVASYHWDFGDGQTADTSTATTTHVYETADDYTVTLTVTDDSGCSTVQTFTGQTVSCNGSPLALTSHQVTVPPGEPLSVFAAGTGSGSVTSSPAGIDCPGACAYSFEPGTQVTLTPDPASGSTFAGWSGEGCSGTEPCEVTVDADAAVTATFDELPPPPERSCEERGDCPPPPVVDPPPVAQASVPAQLRIKRVQGRRGVVVGGTIATAARGAVRVKASGYVDGRRISVSRRARIVDGRWRARLRLLAGSGQDALLLVVARFQGSPGVQGGHAKRRVQGLPPT